MHHLPEAPLHKSVIFLRDQTTFIGADFHISPNNWLLTLTFTLTLTCGARQPVTDYAQWNFHRDTWWTLTGRQEEIADLCVRSMPAGDSGSHIIAGHKHCCANTLYTILRHFWIIITLK